MKQFAEQEQTFIKKIRNKYNIDNVNVENVTVGTKAHVEFNRSPNLPPARQEVIKCRQNIMLKIWTRTMSRLARIRK